MASLIALTNGPSLGGRASMATVTPKRLRAAVHTGPIENAAAQERALDVIFAIGDEMGPYVYRFAPVDQL